MMAVGADDKESYLNQGYETLDRICNLIERQRVDECFLPWTVRARKNLDRARDEITAIDLDEQSEVEAELPAQKPELAEDEDAGEGEGEGQDVASSQTQAISQPPGKLSQSCFAISYANGTVDIPSDAPALVIDELEPTNDIPSSPPVNVSGSDSGVKDATSVTLEGKD